MRDDGSDLHLLDIGDIFQPSDPDWAVAPVGGRE
jgi:hypothetical protein